MYDTIASAWALASVMPMDCLQYEENELAAQVSEMSQLSPQKHKHYIVTCLSGVYYGLGIR